MFESQQIEQIKVEFASNKRLQWMVLFVGVILLLSAVKAFHDFVVEKASERNSLKEFVVRLEKAAEIEINDELSNEVLKEKASLLSSLPTASSRNTAEANSLAIVNRMEKELFKKGTSNLVGTEEISLDGRATWQVRIEYSGQMEQENLTRLLTHFDGSNSSVRLVSFRYRPARSGALSMVVDYLYLGDVK